MTRSKPQPTEQDKKIVNWILEQLKAIKPGWKAAVSDQKHYDAIRAQWLEGLFEAGINSREIVEAGLREARRDESPFLPSVGQFAGWCRKGLATGSGLPGNSDAYLAWMDQASRSPSVRSWERFHPAVYWAHLKLAPEARDLLSAYGEMAEHRRRKRFNEVWQQAEVEAAAGRNFAALLPSPTGKAADVVATPEQKAAAAMARESLKQLIDD